MQESTTKVDTLRKIVQAVADERARFFEIKGQGAGNYETNEFIARVRDRATGAFGQDFSEQRICGDSHHAVDFYFPDEATIVEIALGLRYPNSEFEKDVLKALMAQEHYPVERLVLIGKPGAVSQCKQPSRQAVIQWAYAKHGLRTEVYDIEHIPDAALPDNDEVES